MTKDECMKRQLITSLNKEIYYLSKYNKELQNPNLIGEAREKVIIFRDSNIEAINRFRKQLLRYA